MSVYEDLGAVFAAAITDGQANEAIVKAAYEDLLGYDDADTMENAAARVDYWVEKLDAGELTPANFGGSFLEEANTHQGDLISETTFKSNQAVVEALVAAYEDAGGEVTLEALTDVAIESRGGDAADENDDVVVQPNGGGGNANAGGNPFTATAGDDTITGTAGDDVIDGLGGNDTISGLGGADTLRGGDGDDTLVADNADVEINGGAGTDTVQFGQDFTWNEDDRQFESVEVMELTAAGLTLNLQPDTLFFTMPAGAKLNGFANGSNTIVGSNGSESINGGSGDDTLSGNTGQDTINGAGGNDQLTGGPSNDTFIIEAGTDTITDLSDSDVLDIRPGASVTATVDANYTATDASKNLGGAAANAAFEINIANADGGSADFSLFDVTDPAARGITVDVLDDFVADITVTGTDADDVMTGGDPTQLFNETQTLNGGGGGDEITGGTGDDTLNGDAGDDTITGGAGGDTINGGAGADTVEITRADSAVNDTVDGGAGADTMTLADGLANGTLTDNTINLADFDASDLAGVDAFDNFSNFENIDVSAETTNGYELIGTATANVITGGAGADTIIGGAGDDEFTGGAGADTFNVDAGTDTVNDLSGSDVLVVSDGATATATVTADFTATTATQNDNGTATLNVENDVDADLANANDGLTVAVAEDGYTLDASGNGAASTLVGSNANDVITGGDGNDIITGGAGADILTGGNGDDTFAYVATGESQNLGLANGVNGNVSDADVITDLSVGDVIHFNYDEGGNFSDGPIIGDATITADANIGNSATYGDLDLVSGIYDDASGTFTAGAADDTNDDLLLQWNDGTNINTVIFNGDFFDNTKEGGVSIQLAGLAAEDTLTVETSVAAG